ncbi:MAG TPA: Gfo/Idh/MocA family oxidoreductase [Dehalococcoidia bacterium]|jgi:predicted dehydrogenase|nr:Gfo/Idh/MocA family oxidoreductase [Dehalococcoidia bacterium]HIK98204.1 Gfo/Idh/MocA family oxidoreductase [Dehalococcoidia bacterium]
MSNGRVKVGFIGAGTISSLHELGYHDNETGELYAIADPAPGLAQSRKEQWGVQKAYIDYKDLLGDPSVDAVEILLPHHLHLPITLEALSAGKHVSLQKPMAISMDEGRQIAAAAAGSDKVFRVVENYRTYEPYMQAKAMIEAGDIGDLITIRVMMIRGKGQGGIDTPPSAQAWRDNLALGGPAQSMLDYGYHVTSIVTYFMGKIDKVNAMSDLDGPEGFTGIPAVISWRHTGGQYGNWNMVTAPNMMVRTKYYPLDEWIEITGTRGIIWINRCTGDLLGKPPVEMYRDGEIRSYSDMETDWGDSFRVAAHNFTDAIVNGTQPDMDGKEAVHALAFALGAIKSASEGRDVKLAEL